jgi:hypothetical protein
MYFKGEGAIRFWLGDFVFIQFSKRMETLQSQFLRFGLWLFVFG